MTPALDIFNLTIHPSDKSVSFQPAEVFKNTKGTIVVYELTKPGKKEGSVRKKRYKLFASKLPKLDGKTARFVFEEKCSEDGKQVTWYRDASGKYGIFVSQGVVEDI